jgi:AcrR family transcriptional regulator
MIHIMFAAARGETNAPPPLPPKPQQARGKEKRERVYEAALNAFGEHGFDQARIEDVVADAGVSWGTFFRYFPRKEDVLLEAGARHYREHVRPRAEAALAGNGVTVREAIHTMIGAMLTSDFESHLHGAMLREITATPLRFAALMEEDEAPWLVVVAELVRAGQERGEVRDDVDALTLGAVVLAGSMFPAVQGGFQDLRGLRGIPGGGDPIAILDRAFPVAWRGVEA